MKVPKAPSWPVVISSSLPTGIVTGIWKLPTFPVLILNVIVVFTAAFVYEVYKSK